MVFGNRVVAAKNSFITVIVLFVNAKSVLVKKRFYFVP